MITDKNKKDQTFLHLLLKYQYPVCLTTVKQLIQEGLNLQDEDFEGKTCINYSDQNLSTYTVEIQEYYLEQHGCSVNR